MASTILLADNDLTTLDKWGKSLQIEGYVVHRASNPQETRRVLEREQIDLAVIDIRLVDDQDPMDQSGLEIAADPLYRHIRKIVLSAHKLDYESQRLIWEPHGGQPPAVISVVGKDEGPDILIDRLHRAFETESVSDADAQPAPLETQVDDAVYLSDAESDDEAPVAQTQERDADIELDVEPALQTETAHEDEPPAAVQAGHATMPPWIFGMHDPGDWRDLFEKADKTGWVMFHQVVDDEAATAGNPEFAVWTQRGYGVLVRLVHAPYDAGGRGGGSIPPPEDYDAFAQRCAAFVQNSPGCNIWFIGNDMNVAWHWPNGEPITPELYANCFDQVYRSIKRVQPDALVIPSGLNPLEKPDVEFVDALDWFRAMLEKIEVADGLDIHPFFPLIKERDGLKFHDFERFLAEIPKGWRDLPVFMTLATPPQEWPEPGDGWMQRALARVNRWNCNPGRQMIRAFLPYRWQGTQPDGSDSPWNLVGKPSYHDDLGQALQHDYRWQVEPGQRFGPALEPARALERIQVVISDLSDLTFDALVNPTDTELDAGLWGRQRVSDAETRRSLREDGFVGALRSTWGRVRGREDVRAEERALIPVALGQAVTVSADHLDAKHVIHMPVREKGQGDGTESEGDLARGLEAALALADRLGDVRHLMVPSITTSWRRVSQDSSNTARVLLSTALDHLRAGSRLAQIIFALPDQESYEVYAAQLKILLDAISPGDQTKDGVDQAVARARSVEDPGLRASVLFSAAGSLPEPERAGVLTEAVDAQQAELDSARAARDRKRESQDLISIGVLYRNQSDYERALESFQQLLTISREDGDRQFEMRALDELGNTHHLRGDHERALESYGQLLALTREEGETGLEALTLQKIGTVYRDLDYDRALEVFQQALALAQEEGDDWRVAHILDHMGAVYREMSEYERALEYYQQALALQRELGDTGWQSDTLLQIGAIHRHQAEPEQALESYQQALATSQEDGDRGKQVRVLTVIGAVYGDLSEPERALESYQQGLAISQEDGDRPAQMVILSNIGSLHRDLSDYRSALESFQQVLALAREEGDTWWAGNSLFRIGSIYRQQGQLDGTQEVFQQSLESFRAAGDQSGAADSLLELGWIAWDRGDAAGAQRAFEQALSTFEELEDEPEIAHVTYGLGGAFLDQGDRARAEVLFRRGLALAQSLDLQDAVALHLRGLGRLAAERGDHEEARDLYQQSLAIFEELEVQRGIAWSHYHLGCSAQVQEAYDEAGREYHLALDIFQQDGDRIGTARILYRLGQIGLEQGEYKQAGDYLAQSLRAFEQLGFEKDVERVKREIDGLPVSPYIQWELAERQIWIVTANPRRYKWERALAPEGEAWTGVRGNQAQEFLAQSRPDDIVLAYASSPQTRIAGLGRISEGPFPLQIEEGKKDRQGVRIVLDRMLDRGITLDELREATPNLDHVSRLAQGTRPLSFSPVTPRQWTAIRELILEHNPDLEAGDLLPASEAPPDDLLEEVPRPLSEERSRVTDLLDEGEVDQALTLARQLPQPDRRRSWALCDVVSYLADAGEFDRALAVVDEIQFEHAKAGPLSDVATALVGAGQLDRAREVALRIETPHVRASALGQVAEGWAEAGDAGAALDAAEMAWEAAEGIESSSRRGQMLDRLAPFLPLEPLIAALFEPAFSVQKAALEALYGRSLTDESLDDALRANLAARKEELAPVQALAEHKQVRREVKDWLRSVLVSLEEPAEPVLPDDEVEGDEVEPAPPEDEVEEEPVDAEVPAEAVDEEEGIEPTPPESEIGDDEIEPTPPEVEVADDEIEPTPPEVEVAEDEVEPASPDDEVEEDEVEPTPPEVEVAEDEIEPTPPEVEVAEDEIEPTPPEVEVAEDEVEPTPPKVEVEDEGIEPTPPESEIGDDEIEPTPPEVEVGEDEIQPTPPTLATRPYVEAGADQTTVIIRERIFQNLVQPVTREQDTHTLAVFLSPSVSALEAEVTPEGEQHRQRAYHVLIQWLEESPRGPQKHYFEGPLRLKVGNDPLGRMYGAALFEGLFHRHDPDQRDRLTKGEPGRQLLLDGYRRALERSRDLEHGLHIQLHIDTKSPELHTFKWEYLWDPTVGGVGAVACDTRIPFSRVLHVSSRGDRRPTISRNNRLHILAAMASPAELRGDGPVSDDLRGLVSLDRAEILRLQTGLETVGALVRPLERGRNLLLSPDQRVSLGTLRHRLLEAKEKGQPVHILHLLCHGLIRPADGKAYLVLDADDSDRAELVPEESFAEVIDQFLPDLRLIVLASCKTALPTHEQPLQGIARQLVAAGVPAVVAMQDDLHFDAAQHFSQRLYAQLAHHGVVDRAVNAARRELYDRRKRHKDDDERETVNAKQWGVPVLFMRIPDGRLFDLAKDAPQLTDPDGLTEAVPYSEVPGSDPNSLIEGMMRTMAMQMQAQWNMAVPAHFEPVRQAYEAASAEPEAPTVVEHPRILEREGQVGMRWALIQAAAQHRGHAARRTVLFLRGLARAQIADLVSQEALAALNPDTFRTLIWEGGHATLQNKNAWDIVASGPKQDYLWTRRNLIEASAAEWRAYHRGFDGKGNPISDADRVTTTGNLTWAPTWKGTRRPQLEEGQSPEAADLQRLLYGRGDTFRAFGDLAGDPARQARGLDERIASLLLHAVYPDRYLPYHRDLAQAVLDLLWPDSEPPHEAGFEDYNNLAADLLADDDLGFEDLADVGYFLQRLAEQDADKILFEEDPDYPPDVRLKLAPVRLLPEAVDTGLVMRPGVLEQASAALNAGQHAILIGPPGTGKTTLAEDLCHHAHDLNCNRGHVLVTATADWTTFDTIGGYMPGETGDKLEFRPGIFLEAIEAQKWLVIDEINRSDIDKAFGELFTVLSGQAVTLPYKEDGRPVRILPPGHATSRETRDYVLHPSWRIIGTMNVYDKASLFAMSYAFMRRFAFVDMAVPANMAFRHLIRHFLESRGLPGDEGHQVPGSLYELFDRDDVHNHLMQWRALGPAIALDVVRYLRHRAAGREENPSPEQLAVNLTRGHLAEALLLYVVPQFDGLEQGPILSIHGQLKHRFPEHELPDECKALLGRIEELFPFIRADMWQRTRWTRMVEDQE